MQPGLFPFWWALSAALVLHSTPFSAAARFTTPPQNVSEYVGRAVNFVCGVSAVPGGAQTVVLNFYGKTVNGTMRCPGQEVYIPSQVIMGRCEDKVNELRAVWRMGTTVLVDNSTYVICQAPGIEPVAGYLILKENSSYFATLIGCVMGGFFGILLILVVTFYALKRSEKFQKCLKGRSIDEDINTCIEE